MSRCEARARNSATRTLGRYSLREAHPYKTSEGTTDWSRPVWRVRPAGFDTVLFTVEPGLGAASDDVRKFMRAAQDISSCPVPK